jgi:hypothetical protein
MEKALIHCQTYGGKGMMSHYYHFFFACLLPLIDFSFLDTPCVMSSDMLATLGPFRSIITTELSLCTSYIALDTGPPFHSIVLPSYDIYDNMFYSNASVLGLDPKVTQPHIFQYFDSLISSSTRSDHLIKPAEKLIILVIERHMDPFYHHNINNDTHATANKMQYTSGSTRRRIKNHQALVAALRLQYEASAVPGDTSRHVYTVVNESLEGKSLLAQYRLFHSARLVIAQHGAALANIAFMNKSASHVVEISPPFSRKAMYFRNLAQHLGVSYSSVLQVCSVLCCAVQVTLSRITDIMIPVETLYYVNNHHLSTATDACMLLCIHM